MANSSSTWGLNKVTPLEAHIPLTQTAPLKGRHLLGHLTRL